MSWIIADDHRAVTCLATTGLSSSVKGSTSLKKFTASLRDISNNVLTLCSGELPLILGQSLTTINGPNSQQQ